MSRYRIAVVVCVLVPANSIRADNLDEVEIAKRGKAATAYLELTKQRSGCGFCVHSSGLFITREQMVRDLPEGEIKLVLAAGTTNQKVLKAKVVRTDKQLDLALLKVEGVKDLPALPFASAKDIEELTPVVALGFAPTNPAAEKDDYPALGVNTGKVTSLEVKKNELRSIEIEILLPDNSSGGPVLDKEGKVIGMIAAGRNLGQLKVRAASVNMIERFLTSPDIEFHPPAITRANSGKRVEFKARVSLYSPNAKQPDLQLVLKAEDGSMREFPMTKQGDDFVASAIPIAKPTDTQVEVSLSLSAGTLSGLTNDQTLKVGDKALKLSDIRRISFIPRVAVQLADGKTALDGEISGLDSIEINLGEVKVKMDPSKAFQLTVRAVPEPASLTASIVALVDKKEVARVDSPIIVSDPAKAPDDVRVASPSLDSDKVICKLPEVYTNVVVGGGGRYLILEMPKIKKLAIFDISAGRISKYIPLHEDKVAYAAAVDKLIVGLPEKGALERWNLETAELETTVVPVLREPIQTIYMGYASAGPVVVNGFFYDLATLRPLPIVNKDKQPQIWNAKMPCVASGDASVFTTWSDNGSTAFLVEGNQVRQAPGPGQHACPGPDGNVIFARRGILSSIMQQADPKDADYGYCFPALRGPYFLSTTTIQDGGHFLIYMLGERRPIARLDKINHGLNFDYWDREEFGPWKRIFFVPDANVIAVLPQSNDQVVFYKFDVVSALEKCGFDYLVVTSRPPKDAVSGETYRYPISVLSNGKDISYSVSLAPKGLEVSKSGVVEWKVPSDAKSGSVEDIILTISNANQETFHKFKIVVK